MIIIKFIVSWLNHLVGWSDRMWLSDQIDRIWRCSTWDEESFQWIVWDSLSYPWCPIMVHIWSTFRRSCFSMMHVRVISWIWKLSCSIFFFCSSMRSFLSLSISSDVFSILLIPGWIYLDGWCGLLYFFDDSLSSTEFGWVFVVASPWCDPPIHRHKYLAPGIASPS